MKLADMNERPHQAILERVFRIFAVSGDAHRGREKPSSVNLAKHPEGLGTPTLCVRQELQLAAFSNFSIENLSSG
jgi:hypothetical protein